MPSRELPRPPDPDRTAPTVLDAGRRGAALDKERTARAAVEARAGRTLGDAEWGRARARLLDFVSILRAWHREATASESELRTAA